VTDTATPKRVAAIVLNYNGRELTLQALESLRRLRYPRYDLVVVDNGSTDGSPEAVAGAFPEVHQVRTETNLGPAGGYNLGMVWALERGYDYLLILNNDIEAHPDLLDELVRVAESDPTIGCVGPKTYYFSDRGRLASAGGVIRFKESVTRERGQGARDRGQYDRDREVAYVNGCGMLIRRQAIEAAGLWDPIFFLSVEDADWCMRAKRRGFRCVFAHRAILYHMVSDTTGVYKPAKTFQTGRSSAIFARRYAGPWQWLTFFAFLAAALPVAWLRELRRGNQAAAVAKARGVLAGLRAPLTPPPTLEDARRGALGEAVSRVLAEPRAAGAGR
jgi:GT2 family glycosyltransferase